MNCSGAVLRTVEKSLIVVNALVGLVRYCVNCSGAVLRTVEKSLIVVNALVGLV